MDETGQWRTYSLEEVVDKIGLTGTVDDPGGWLVRRILAGVVPARKMGRKWRMTAEDIDATLEALRGNTRRPRHRSEEAPRTGLSRGSRMRRGME